MARYALAHADFVPLLPERLPRGYHLDALLAVPGLGSALTFEFRNARGGLWSMVQRVSLQSFTEELAQSSAGWRLRTRAGRRYAFTAAAFVGEPVERHHTTSRQTAWWEQCGLMIELERVEGHAPGWRALWVSMETLRPATSAVPTS